MDDSNYNWIFCSWIHIYWQKCHINFYLKIEKGKTTFFPFRMDDMENKQKNWNQPNFQAAQIYRSGRFRDYSFEASFIVSNAVTCSHSKQTKQFNPLALSSLHSISFFLIKAGNNNIVLWTMKIISRLLCSVNISKHSFSFLLITDF